MDDASEQRAWILVRQKRFVQAIAEIQRALAASPNSAKLHGILALCHTDNGQPREALNPAKHAIQLCPDNPWLHYIYGWALFKLKRYDKAKALAVEALRLAPRAAYLHNFMAQIHCARGNWEPALRRAEEALAIDPLNTRAANWRAMALTHLDGRDDAVETLHGALERDPETALTHANLGWALLHDDDPRGAMGCFAEALRLNPDYEWAMLGILEAMRSRSGLYRFLLKVTLGMIRKSNSMGAIHHAGILRSARRCK